MTADDKDVAVVEKESTRIQSKDDGLQHFFETCCTHPNFRTLCGRSLIYTGKIVLGGSSMTHRKSLCVICQEIAKTPYFCRGCGRKLGLS